MGGCFGRRHQPIAAGDQPPLSGQGAARESACSNLSSVFGGCPSFLSAFLSLLMVVQTFPMKIQEPPVSCDAGRVGGGDADCDKPSCEDVPRLDLTALTEENSWGGRPSGCSFHPRAACLSHTQDYFIPKYVEVWSKSAQRPAPHMVVWAAAAHVPPLRAPPSASPTGFKVKRSSWDTHICRRKWYRRRECLPCCQKKYYY